MLKQTVKRFFVVSSFICMCYVHAHAQTPAKELFGHTALPSVSEPRVYGFYSKGCIGGAVAMPKDGATWQAMRIERNRRWGHPELIALLQDLAQRAPKEAGWPGLLVGDISQPRGGPMLSGHASHQIGLDADIWLTPMPSRRLTQKERRETSAISMLQGNGSSLYVDDEKWTYAHGELLKLAAKYGSVERIFIHPGIKKKMCQTYGNNKTNNSWMIKLRPYYGHHYHFHIRMACPETSPDCRAQDPVPSHGNGCDASLDWWFTDEPWRPAKPTAKPKPKRIVTIKDLPTSCARILHDPQAANEAFVTLTDDYSLVRAQKTAIKTIVPKFENSTLYKLPIPNKRPHN